MATKRDSTYVWVTWLSRIMSGDNPCVWQAWFMSNYEYEKAPDDFDVVGWKMDHSRMLNELTTRLRNEGLSPRTEYPIKYEPSETNITLAGKIDCIVDKGDEVRVFDCKTGQERTSDQVQVMLYMYILNNIPEYKDKKITGEIVYKKQSIPIPELTKNFNDNFLYFANILSEESSPAKMPGDSCRFCKITKNDCPERVD